VRILRRAIGLAVLLWILAPASASAQSGWLVTPFLGMKFDGSTSIADLELAESARKSTYGVSGAFLTEGLLGVEAEFGWVPGFFENGRQNLVRSSSVVDLSGSLVLALPPSITRGGLRPYAVAGVAVVHADAADVLDLFRIRRTVPALNLGVGAIGLLTNSVGVRFDLRNLHSFNKGKDPYQVSIGRNISYWRTTIGIVRRF
jgi:hypothetical protein